ncbi:hypothetical protein EDEG_03359 [Edhazardia aedis USNM 41457]|uniref:Uncharacterized protein n=1 Tax=Edhazardia aedis (strain USNM 41457) TaxID=1003232 RepID=J9DHW1_EDHAE|nr:hypothetical protein EDEG_03359 [Edhazardia aedis USNM 41457]|eukprot:EJW02205.1 hypothetical protein EDEG_03359 [Edhazardia aedis USNM 41457]
MNPIILFVQFCNIVIKKYFLFQIDFLLEKLRKSNPQLKNFLSSELFQKVKFVINLNTKRKNTNNDSN